MAVKLGASEKQIGRVSGNTKIVSASFIRPADTTAYAIGELVANSTTAGLVVPMMFNLPRIAGGSGMIRRVRITTSSTSVTAAQFRLHLYNEVPVPANGDNAAWSTSRAFEYIDAMDVTVDRAFTDGARGTGIAIVGSEINFAVPVGLVVYGLLEARAAYTPTSEERFTVTLEVMPN